MREEYDVAIIGGGINGCGIARDAAGRGLSVLLAEQSDLAAATSSASSKLIHGGLRYLEHYAFRLVRESLCERAILLDIAPHIISPLRFVLPHVRNMRPEWMIHSGLFLYDCLAGGVRRLPRSRKISLKNSPLGAPLAGIDAAVGFEYYDCHTDDARLVMLNARDAALQGADVCTRTRCVSAVAKNKRWHLQLKKQNDVMEASAKCLINATGPWALHFLQQINAAPARPKALLRLVQGSHIIVPMLYEGDHAYLLQSDDGRIVFTLPYEKKFTLVGTTDRDFDGNPNDATVSDEEVEYLQNIVKHYFGDAPSEITRRFCGVRPLAAGNGVTAEKASRDYLLRLEFISGAPLLNIFGGKLTTYRKLAESAVDKLTTVFPTMKPAWTASHPLPGGALPGGGMAAVVDSLIKADERITLPHAERLARAYGSVATILPAFVDDDDKWQRFGNDLFAWEVDYLMQYEWAMEVDDILWRRSALGINFLPQQREQLAHYMRGATAHA